MNAVSNTAFYCCGVRAEDAKHPRSVCQDVFAERFMDKRGREIFEPFKTETMPNISNLTRCKIIDELVQEEIRKNPETNVVTIGAGFDTRPYRLKGGVWTEIDEPQIIDYKEKKLPTSECRNPLDRLSIDFATESPATKLTPTAEGTPTVVVIEGVFMYLDADAIDETILELRSLYPQHVLLCDLMTKNFFAKFAQSVHSKLSDAGGTFTERPDVPEQTFIEHGYVEFGRTPMFRRATELGLLWERAKIPSFVARLMLGVFMTDLNGYAVHRFRYAG